MTTKLPPQYAWLADERAPKLLVEFLKIHGTVEKAGAGNNPEIMRWAEVTGLRKVYTADSIPWCGLGMAYVAHMAGKPVVKDPLWALNWAKFGVAVDHPELGDIVAFKRDGGGHVGIYVGEDATAYHVLGCNQSDACNITRIAKSRLYAARRPIYNVQPANVRRVHLAASGALSRNEA